MASRTSSLALLKLLGGCATLLGLDEYDTPPNEGTISASGAGGGGGPGGTGGDAGAPACAPRVGQGGCDFLGSDQSCAYCGNDCLNGSCVDGARTAGQVGTRGGYRLAADDTHLFFRSERDDLASRRQREAHACVREALLLRAGDDAIAVDLADDELALVVDLRHHRSAGVEAHRCELPRPARAPSGDRHERVRWSCGDGLADAWSRPLDAAIAITEEIPRVYVDDGRLLA